MTEKYDSSMVTCDTSRNGVFIPVFAMMRWTFESDGKVATDAAGQTSYHVSAFVCHAIRRPTSTSPALRHGHQVQHRTALVLEIQLDAGTWC